PPPAHGRPPAPGPGAPPQRRLGTPGPGQPGHRRIGRRNLPSPVPGDDRRRARDVRTAARRPLHRRRDAAHPAAPAGPGGGGGLPGDGVGALGEGSPGDDRRDRRPAREGAFFREDDKSVQQLGDIETLDGHPVPLLEVVGEGVEFGACTAVTAEVEAVVECPVTAPVAEGGPLQSLYAGGQEAALEYRYPESVLV